MSNQDPIAAAFSEHEELVQLTYSACASDLQNAILRCRAAIQAGGKLLVFGNGGSAADAAHIVAELTGRYLRERAGLPALSLSNNMADITSIANDFGFASVFSRQIEALGRPGDICLAISTSGNSENILRGLEQARRMKLTCIGLGGKGGGAMSALCDICICVPSDSTPRIQEMHALLGHLLCGGIESEVNG